MSIKINLSTAESIVLGYVGENEAREVVFDCSCFADAFGAGTLAADLVLPGTAEPIPAAIVQDGNSASWLVTSACTGKDGYGALQLRWLVGDVVAKSAIYTVYFERSLAEATGEVPDPVKDWYNSLVERIGDAHQSVIRAEEFANESATSAQQSATSAQQSATSASNASASATSAQGSASSASASAQTAQSAQQSASASASSASASATKAETAKSSAETAKAAAETAKANAQSSASSASASATRAETASAEAVAAAESVKGIASDVEELKGDVVALDSKIDRTKTVLTPTPSGISISVDGQSVDVASVESVEDLREDLEIQKKVSQGILWDAVSQEEDGSNVSPKGAVAMSLDEVRGKTEQDSTNGYQLIPFPYSDADKTSNGLTFTVNEDGSVTIKGTATAPTNFYFTNAEKGVLEDGTYTVSATGLTTGVTAQGWHNWSSFYVGQALNLSTIRTSLSGEIKPNGNQYRIAIVVSSGASVDTTVRCMLEKGTTAHPYEPYTGGIPSPNPDYPQEIKSVEEVHIKRCGKNLLNNYYYGDFDATTGTITKTGSGSLVFFDIPIGINKVTLSYKNAKDANRAPVIIYDENNNYVGRNIPTKYPSAGADYFYTYELTGGYRYVWYYSKSSFLYASDIMIESGTTATPYEPYTETTYTITPPKPLNRIGEYYDKADVENGVWVWNNGYLTADRFIKSVVQAGQTGARFIAVVDDLLPVTYGDFDKGMCDKFTAKNTYSYGAVGEYITFGDEAKRIFVRTADDMSIADFKQLNPMVLYRLVEPTTSPISPSDLAFLRSLEKLPPTDNIIITDQLGRPVPWLAEYIRKLSEV